MNTIFLRLSVLLITMLSAPLALAVPVDVPVTLNYQVLQNILASRLVPALDEGADLFNDGWDCNVLNLKRPRIAGTDNGHLLLRAELSTRGGTPLGSRCLSLFTWDGILTTELEPYISADGTRLGFRIVESALGKEDPNQPTVPGKVWDWVKAHVHPELERFGIDLKPLLTATRGLVATAVPDTARDFDHFMESVRFSAISGNGEQLQLLLSLDVPGAEIPAMDTLSDSFSDAEIARWDAAWQSWDAFLTWLIKDLAGQLGQQDPALVEALANTLLEARYDLRLALVNRDLATDPVRDLFLKTWERLMPVLQRELQDTPELDALRFLTFISAVDALVAVDSVAQSFNVTFDSATFRSLARLVSATVSDEQLEYDTAVDPALRTLLGLPPVLEEEPSSLEELWRAPLSLLVPRAHAAALDPKLVEKLTNWVPATSELDGYLASVNLLLHAILEAERDKGKVPEDLIGVYENLALATAWQESCWRQYERRGGQVTPLRSSAGSVGLMQVNQHVWRGVYDPEKLNGNIGYNARAGNEILVHYLVDFAIKRGEHTITGDKHSLARSAYAMYNGGPRHISRYRLDTTSAYLKKIDNAFWRKYKAVQAEGANAVRSCYGE